MAWRRLNAYDGTNRANMEKPMYLRNCWYVAGWSKDYSRELKAQKLLGENVVFYRQSDGSAVALEDACPHRKLPLSKGQLDGDTVVCG
jgi:vanillate O-demethylase monooxygenase subunit